MDMKLINKDKRSIEIMLSKEDENLVQPLEHALLNDSKTEYAAYTKKHPFLDDPIIGVVVKEGKPQTALKRASRTILRDLGNFETRLERAIDKYRTKTP